MILLDLSQTLIASLMVTVHGKHAEPIDVDFMRHIVLNKIRFLNSQFRKEYYGQHGLIIVCDSTKSYWRKKFFPYYKAKRNKDREASLIDWTNVYKIIDMLKEELKNNFPYKVIEVENAEADDIIGTIVHKFGEQEESIGDLLVKTAEKILIISGDEDFIQLHKYANVSQYNSVKKKWIKSSNPERDLLEKIISGDSGDGIPNILSDDDTLINSEKRQKPLRANKLKSLIEDENSSFWDQNIRKNFYRNETLIDLSNTPIDLKEKIIETFSNPPLVPDRSKIYKYCVKNRLALLSNHLSDF